MRFRDQKREARKILHAELSELVYVFSDKNAEPVPATARLHLSFEALGQLRRAGFAESVELTPKAIFIASEVSPSRGWAFVTEDMGGYFIEQVDPPDDITVTTRITRMSAAQHAVWGIDVSLPYGGRQNG